MVITFFYSLGGGMLFVLATARVEQIAWKFIRLVGFLVFAMACLATAWAMRPNEGAFVHSEWAWHSGLILGICAMFLALLAPLSQRYPTLLRALCFAGGLAGLASGCIAVVALAAADDPPLTSLPIAMLCIGQIFAAMLLGSITVAWLLGHAYLTATKMTIAPLRHFSSSLLAAVGMRFGFMFVALGLPVLGGLGTNSVTLATLSGVWLLLVLRVGGLVAVGAFAYMVADCVRRRATQSATGILYFGSVFAYVGELTALQLATDFGWPI